MIFSSSTGGDFDRLVRLAVTFIAWGIVPEGIEHEWSAMRSRVVALLLLSCFCLGAQAFTWKACDEDKVPFVPDNVLLVPDPPAAGGQVTFNIKGNAGEQL